MITSVTPGGRRILVVSGSVGAGHNGAAAELARRLTLLGAHTDTVDFLDAIPYAGQRLLRDGYTVSIGHLPRFFEWLFQSIDDTQWVRSTVINACRIAAATMRSWRLDSYHAIVSTYPLASQTLGRLKRDGEVAAPLITYLTDPAVHRLWVHEQVDNHFTVTDATARQGMARYGMPMRATGALVPPAFSSTGIPARRCAMRGQLGLSQHRPVALVVTGSLGLGAVPAAVQATVRTGICDALVLCGRNEKLRRSLGSLPGVTALGWRDDVPDLMAACDLLIHNAGGLSLTEALVAGLPAVTFQPLPGHGRANAALLEAAGLAPWPRTEADLSAALRSALRSGSPDPRRVTPAFETAAAVAALARQPQPGSAFGRPRWPEDALQPATVA